jgi:transposase
MRHALDSLAVAAPGWLRARGRAEWVEQYGRRADDSRLPAAAGDRQVFAQQVGQDGHALLAAAYARSAPPWLGQNSAVETLRRVWIQQFVVEAGRVRWRTEEDGIPPAGAFISSPHDVEARYAVKRSTSWVGYKCT